MGKAKMERRKREAVARPLEVSRLEGRKGQAATMARLKKENANGANVPARVVERMGGSTRNARTSLNDSGPQMRPKRKPRTVGSEAAAAGLIGRDYGSKGDSVKRLTGDQIRAKREKVFAEAEKSRNARAAEIVSRPVPVRPDAVAQARTDYRNAIARANERRAVGDESGAEAWMRKAREFRKIFRNK